MNKSTTHDYQYILDPILKDKKGILSCVSIALSSIVIRLLINFDDLNWLLSFRIVALLWVAFWASAFVLSLYIWTYDEPFTPELRNTPYVIIQRFMSVTSVVFSCIILTPVSWIEMGVIPSILDNIIATFIGLLIHVVMFLGPLVFAYFDSDEFPSTSVNLVNFRSIIFGPIMEEIVFRACMVPVWIRNGFPTWAIVVIVPLFFGIAHLHHMLNSNGKYLIINLLGRSFKIPSMLFSALFQGLYTTVFGAMCSFYFLRTGNLMAPIAAHVFCNFMGFPSFDFMEHKMGKVIAASYVIGLAGYVVFLFPITSPWMFQYSPYGKLQS